MTNFPIYTIDSAPEDSKAALGQLRAAFGMIPNVAAVMAMSPVLIDSLVGLFGRVHSGSFDEAQLQVVLLTDAVANKSTWAVAFHSALALEEGVSTTDVEAIRAGGPPRDVQFAALSALATRMIEQRGHLSEEEIERFVAAGFRKDHALEVVAIVAASTITNYTASMTKPPLEAPFQEFAWTA